MRILIAAGGTGGHVYPAVALAERLLARGDELNWLGRPGSLEESEARRLGIPFVAMPLEGFKRRLALSNLRAFLYFFQGRRLALETVNAFRPHILFALGSYVSAPTISAAVEKKVPVIVHEQNVVPGLVVRYYAGKVTKVALSRPLIRPIKGSSEVVGLPLRPNIVLSRSASHYTEYGLDPGKKTLFVFGGSQGARALCRVSIRLAEHWLGERPDWQIFLQTGRANAREIEQQSIPGNLVYREHLSEIGKAYACADVIVARSGATSCAEIAAVGKPAILVPYPFATANHQEMNARAHLENYPGRLIPETDLDIRTLEEAVDRLEAARPRPMSRQERERPIVGLLALIDENATGGGENGNRSESAA